MAEMQLPTIMETGSGFGGMGAGPWRGLMAGDSSRFPESKCHGIVKSFVRFRDRPVWFSYHFFIKFA